MIQIKKLQPVIAQVEHYSSNRNVNLGPSVPVVKKHEYKVIAKSVPGDAPKNFIYIYEYGRSLKAKAKSWTPYIAKVGHKWYPTESITEHLITRLGQVWKFNMANSKLYVINNQLRFCSEYFLKKDQELIHGADILSAYLQEADTKIIEQIDRKGWSQEMLSLQFVKKAIEEAFPQVNYNLYNSLVDLLLFDAIVGNNDRHFFNWGVIRSLKSRHIPLFSPIYDSARGLFWNHAEFKIVSLWRDKQQLNSFINRYHIKSLPKIGLDNHTKINHLQIVEYLVVNNECTFDRAQNLFSDDNLTKAESVLKKEFIDLISPVRRDLILYFLEYRFKQCLNYSGKIIAVLQIIYKGYKQKNDQIFSVAPLHYFR